MSHLVHGLFTNAAGRDGRGFRDRWLAHRLDWPEADRRRALEWLRGLRPEGPEPGLAVGCQRLGDVVHAVAGAVFPGFARDEHRRGGFLVHAVWAPLEESAPAPDFGRTLFELHRRGRTLAAELAEREDSARLDPFFEHCQRLTRARWHEPDPARALDEAGERCRLLLDIAAGAHAKELLWPTDDDVEAELTAAASLLPPRLRLSISWSHRASQPAASMRIRTAAAPRPTRESPGSRVLERLRHLSEQGEPGRVLAIVTDWGITSWRQFEQEILP